MLVGRTGHELPWGSLTGIRPTKIALSRLEDGWKEDDIRRFMKETYMTSDEKIDLSVEIAAREKRLMEPINYDSGYSLYVGIPFCYYLPILFLYLLSDRKVEGPHSRVSGCAVQRTGLCGRKEEGLHAGHRLFWRRNPNHPVSRAARSGLPCGGGKL